MVLTQAVRGPGLWAASALGFLRGVGPVSESHLPPPPLGPWLKCCSVGSGWCQPLVPLGTPSLSWGHPVFPGDSPGVSSVGLRAGSATQGQHWGAAHPREDAPGLSLSAPRLALPWAQGVTAQGSLYQPGCASWPGSWMLRSMTYSEGGDLRT